ncbi:LOW QUALITY PROTEIN: hypothetical protein QYF61_000262 [Mycteria americana]|uniref:Uncharacterized protein n=1 Tax=Mycteria americana TaxID=33587 RepID=A0AAN7RV52_MYCAM|nr:LOW QUALITY PROTEIN: hypothetical protein QYF61_000262 [Mycteria americana]
MLDNTFGEKIFPDIQSKPPLVQLEAVSSCPITCYLGKGSDPHLATTSFQVVVESNKVSPQPSFLQAKPPQFPQLLLAGLVLQTLHQLCCPSLDMLQHLNVFLGVRGPKLNTVFEVWPCQCRVQGDNHFPSPAGHTISDTSQDVIDLLGHLGTLLAHIQLPVDQHSLLCWASFQPLFPKPVALHGVVVTQGHLPIDQVAQSPIQPVLEHFQGWGIHNFSGQPVPASHHPHILEGCYKVSLQPSLLEAEQPQLSQAVFIGEVLQPSDHLHGPPLDSFQQVHVLLTLGPPELNAVLQPGIWLAFWAASTDCHIMLSFSSTNTPKAALNPFSAQPVFVLGIALTHVQDLALGLVDLHEVCMGPPLLVPLDGMPSLQHVDRTTQLGVIGKLDEGALNPTVHVANKGVKQHQSQYRPLRSTTHHWSPLGH